MAETASDSDKPAGDSGPAAGPDGPAARNSLNDQILDSLTALAAGGEGNASGHAAAMLSLASAHSSALALYNAVARQQADSAIASAAVAASCARMMGSALPPVPPGEPPTVLVAVAEAQAAAGVQALRALAAQSGDPAGARSALERIAEAAAAPLAPADVQEDAKGRRRRAPAASKSKG